MSSTELSIADTLEKILSSVYPLSSIRDTVKVALSQAFGRVLAVDIVAKNDLPAHALSAVNGYAVRLMGNTASRSDTSKPTNCTVVGKSMIGKPFSRPIHAKEAIHITAGALLPEGADTVVAQEQMYEVGEEINLPADISIGMNLRKKGEDISVHDCAIRTGQKIGAREMAVLAKLGIRETLVFRPVRVAYFSTGNELVPIGLSPQKGEIYDSYRFMLQGLLAEMGALVQASDFGVMPDNPTAIEATLKETCEKSDVVVSIGRVWQGEAPFIRPLMEKMGKVHFWQTNAKPAFPLAYGRVGKAWFFGLNGEALSNTIAFVECLRPAIEKLSGMNAPPAVALCAKLASAMKKTVSAGHSLHATTLREYWRGKWVRVDNIPTVEILPETDTGSVVASLEADCLVVVPENKIGVEVGEWVEVIPLR